MSHYIAPIAGIACTFIANPVVGIITLTLAAIVLVARAKLL